MIEQLIIVSIGVGICMVVERPEVRHTIKECANAFWTGLTTDKEE